MCCTDDPTPLDLRCEFCGQAFDRDERGLIGHPGPLCPERAMIEARERVEEDRYADE